MTVINKTNKNYKRSQRGRSMVEMLGVLAIVGVLSVGGVYGYGVAMKKHKANELLHQASMLATTISAQIASGKTDLALENFGNSSNGSFSSVKGPDGSTDYQSGDDKFTMQITAMDEAVCKQMQGMKGGTVRSVSCGTPDANGKVTATLTFNKDLSSKPVASDYNNDQSACEADSSRQYCASNNTCISVADTCPSIGPSCAPNGDACTSNDDCCNDNCNSSGYCGDDGCTPNGNDAGIPYECCSGILQSGGKCVSCVENGYRPFDYEYGSATQCCSGQWDHYKFCGEKPDCIPDGGVADQWDGITCCSESYVAPGLLDDNYSICVECIPKNFIGSGRCCEGLLNVEDSCIDPTPAAEDCKDEPCCDEFAGYWSDIDYVCVEVAESLEDCQNEICCSDYFDGIWDNEFKECEEKPESGENCESKLCCDYFNGVWNFGKCSIPDSSEYPEDMSECTTEECCDHFDGIWECFGGCYCTD